MPGSPTRPAWCMRSWERPAPPCSPPGRPCSSATIRAGSTSPGSTASGSALSLESYLRPALVRVRDDRGIDRLPVRPDRERYGLADQGHAHVVDDIDDDLALLPLAELDEPRLLPGPGDRLELGALHRRNHDLLLALIEEAENGEVP